MKQFFASVISNKEIAPETHLIWLESAGIATTSKPGQFVMASCGGGTLLRRPLSIHGVDRSRFSLLFRIVGEGTYWLAQRQIGNIVDVFGPLGNGFVIQPLARKILLIAGGIGLTPLVYLAKVAATHGIKATLLIGTSSAAHFPDLPIDGVNIVKATDDGSEGYNGPVTDLIKNHLDRVDQVFACGPLPMYRTMSRMSELKDKSVQVSLEVRMACGLGICYACTIKTRNGLKQVCNNGPVFDLNDVLWDEVAC